MSLNTAMADDGKDYVIVELGGAFSRGGRSSVSLRDSFDYKRNELNIKYYTKEECEKDVYDYVEKQKDYENYSIIGNKTYTFESYPEIFDVYLCIKKDMWDQIKFSKFFVDLDKEVNDYISGQEILYKNLNDFAKKMKSCGIVPFDFQHLPVPETPLICNKYSEENPIPVITLEDSWKITKEVVDNKKDFNEVLKDILESKK